MNHLGLSRIIKIANYLSYMFELGRVDENAARRNYYSPYGVPQVVANPQGTLWVDKYYIAYCMNEDDELHYVYLTWHHIIEERRSYREAAGQPGAIKPVLPEDIAEQFKLVQAYLKENKTAVWVKSKAKKVAV